MTQESRTEEEKYKERIVRILDKDIEGGMKLYAGLTKIKGVSWSMANAVCKMLKITPCLCKHECACKKEFKNEK